MPDVLIVIPTYNERDNISHILAEIFQVLPECNVLVVDDGSPDGTAEVVRTASQLNKAIFLLERECKLGIGSAHLAGIKWAYEKQYRYLVTMDADLTHDPKVILEMQNFIEAGDIVVGSRFILPNSLPGWSLPRRFLSRLGHFASCFFLKLPYDATNAFRLYNLEKVPLNIFSLINSTGYSFFFESLNIFHKNGFKILEVAISLPARTAGHSKMSGRQILISILTLIQLYVNERAVPDSIKFKNVSKFLDIRTHTAWEQYWNFHNDPVWLTYDILATIYRNLVIRPFLSSNILQFVERGANILHAGCGSGQVDQLLRHWSKITAIDSSAAAVKHYQQTNYPYANALVGDILNLPFEDESFDAVYNLGVMEHFSNTEIDIALQQFKRVLVKNGLVILFWPHSKSPMRAILRAFSILSNRTKDDLIPPEINRIRSKHQMKTIAEGSGFALVYYYFGIRDLFTQSVIVLKKL